MYPLNRVGNVLTTDDLPSTEGITKDRTSSEIEGTNCQEPPSSPSVENRVVLSRNT